MEDLIKGELDWHNKVNENFHEVDSQMADIATVYVEKFPRIGAESDDSPRVNRAIASANNIGRIIFSPKTYNCNSGQILFNQNNIIYEGTKGTIIASTYGVIPYEVSGSNIVFNGIEFQNNNIGSDGVSLDFAQNATNILIENCRFIGKYARINISNTGISDVTVNKCYFELCKHTILVNANSSDMRRLNITNCIFKNCNGITLNTPNNIYGSGIKEVIISNNICHTDIQYLIDNNLIQNFEFGTLVSTSGATDVVVTNNTINGYYLFGIDFEDEASEIVVSGNKIKNCYGDGKIYTPGVFTETGDFVKYSVSGFMNVYWAMNNGITGMYSNVNRWTHDTSYNIGDLVYVDANNQGLGEVYKCTVSGVSGGNPPTKRGTSITDNTVIWTWVNLYWTSGTVYTVGGRILSNGNVYQCVTSGTAGVTAPSGTGTNISDGGAVWNYVNTNPVHTSGQISDGGINWQYLRVEVASFWANGLGAGINFQDVDYATVSGNICDRSGQYGIMLETRAGYPGARDNSANAYCVAITGNTCTRNKIGIDIQTYGQGAISVNGNILENNTTGIQIDHLKESLIVSNNIISNNVNGLYIGGIFNNITIGINNFSRNINPIYLQTGVFRGGVRINTMNECQSIWTPSGSYTGNISMFSLGSYAKGQITLTSRSNSNDYVNQIYDITWNGSILTQTKLFEYINGSVINGTIGMSGSNITAQIQNNNSGDYVGLSLSFNGIMFLR